MKVSVYLQKVILLPRLDKFKSCIFTSRLVVFKEPFSQLCKNGDDIAIVWHEALAERTDEDMSHENARHSPSLADRGVLRTGKKVKTF